MPSPKMLLHSNKTWSIGSSTGSSPSPPHHLALDHPPFDQCAPLPSGRPSRSLGHRRQQHPQSCVPWPRWCVQAYSRSLLDSAVGSHSFCGWPSGRCSISWPCMAWGGCTLQCESALIQRISTHKLSYWWRWTKWQEPSELSASPWMRTWRSPRNEGGLQAPPDPQRHRSVSPSPTTATPRHRAGRCPRRWNVFNKRSQTYTTDQVRSGGVSSAIFLNIERCRGCKKNAKMNRGCSQSCQWFSIHGTSKAFSGWS